jgi:hypothetical protein
MIKLVCAFVEGEGLFESFYEGKILVFQLESSSGSSDLPDVLSKSG